MSKTLTPDHPVFTVTNSDDLDVYELLKIYSVDKGKTRIDRDGMEYETVGSFLEDDDFYQGLNMITIFKRKSDGKLFGYSWWDDISKHGESYLESNGDEFDLDGLPEDGNWDNYVSFYVFSPVEEYSITAYKKVDE